MALKKWKKLSAETVKENDYWSYRLDKYKIDENYSGEYHYVHTGGSTMIVPVTSDGKFILVNQYRYLVDRESLEFPCGSVEKGLAPDENAMKELREESGFAAEKLEKVGEFAPYNGVADELCYVYIADSLKEAPIPSDKMEEFEIALLTSEQINSLIDDGTIWDGMTIAAWRIAEHKIKTGIK